MEELIKWMAENSVNWMLECNPHNGVYQTVEGYLKDHPLDNNNQGLIASFKDGDVLWELQAYPSTPNTCYVLWDTSLPRLFERMKPLVETHRSRSYEVKIGELWAL